MRWGRPYKNAEALSGVIKKVLTDDLENAGHLTTHVLRKNAGIALAAKPLENQQYLVFRKKKPHRGNMVRLNGLGNQHRRSCKPIKSTVSSWLPFPPRLLFCYSVRT